MGTLGQRACRSGRIRRRRAGNFRCFGSTARRVGERDLPRSPPGGKFVFQTLTPGPGGALGANWAAAEASRRRSSRPVQTQTRPYGRGCVNTEVDHVFAVCHGRRSRRRCGSFDAACGVGRPIGRIHALVSNCRTTRRRGRGRPGLVGPLGTLASQRMGLACAPVGLGLAPPLCRRASPPLLDRPLGLPSLCVVTAGARSAA